ncbi:hypothetical protein [Chroococcus sp. FPU101]|uniref:hypothetical protein n=1 Tax=Chroococcus sp. FPU101 TaxID=1974212 RepID=UPI001A8DB339|nr:hypothetical protein [Chroococcus sp. FPU101]GFE68210.1 hypothetical protein Cyan7822_1777 [Chroococcus sp. FPU101]
MEEYTFEELDLQDISIVLAISNNNPAILTPNFLQGSGIVPTDWKLVGPPTFSPAFTQVGFDNGITVSANYQTVIFGERLAQDQPLEALKTPQIVSQYLTTLPHLDYHAIGINPIRFITFENRSLTAHQYMTEKLLNQAVWQKNGITPTQIALNVSYTLERSQLQLIIKEVQLQLPGREVPAVMFGGNFHYAPCHSDSEEERLHSFKQILADCPADLRLYHNLLDQQFLVGITSKSISTVSLTTV